MFFFYHFSFKICKKKDRNMNWILFRAFWPWFWRKWAILAMMAKVPVMLSWKWNQHTEKNPDAKFQRFLGDEWWTLLDPVLVLRLDIYEIDVFNPKRGMSKKGGCRGLKICHPWFSKNIHKNGPESPIKSIYTRKSNGITYATRLYVIDKT